MKILATYNLKGGVGKTSTAVNIAYLAAQEGYRTLLWDLDPQGTASFCFRVKPKIKGGIEGLRKRKNLLQQAVKATDFASLDLVPADFSMRNFDQVFSEMKRSDKQLVRFILPLIREYDLLILDCAPSISLMTENIFHAADALLVPLIPSVFSVRTYEQLTEYLRKSPGRQPKLIPFFSMYDSRRQLHRQIRSELPKEFDGILRTVIPYSKRVELMGVERKPISCFAPESKPSLAYRRLWQEIQERALADL